MAAEGAITGFVLGPANTQDRWQLDAMLTWRVTPDGIPWTVDDLPPAHGGQRVGPTGPRWWPASVGRMARCPYVADTGFAGADWQPHWRRDTDAVVLTPRDLQSGASGHLRRQFSGWRPTIETVNGALVEPLHLPFPRAKTMWGVVTRVAAKCAAFNLGIRCNRLLGRPDLALTTLFPG